MPDFDVFSVLECKKRKSRSHGKRKNGNIKRKICIEKLFNTSLKDLSLALTNHGRHGLFSFLSSLPISVLRNLEFEANKLYDRANKLYKAALLTRCYVQHILSPYIGSEVKHKRHFIRVAQSVTCLATDACLTAIPRVASSIPARSHTFVEIDHEIFSTVILLPSADSFKKGCCQLQAKVYAQITGYPLVQACPGKSVVRTTDRPAMTIAVDLGRKATKQTNKIIKIPFITKAMSLLIYIVSSRIIQ